MNESSAAPADAEPTIVFRFKADRFGFRSTALRNDVTFANTVIGAVDDWTNTVEELFGDVGTALNLARDARILPMHPTLAAVNQFRSDVRSQLEAAGPNAKSLDSNARFAVEELRLYLIDLSDWAETFQAGVWAATVAGFYSHAPDVSSKRLQGLRAIALVYDFDKTARPEKVRDELKMLRSQASSALPPELATLAAMGERFTISPKYFGEFAEAAAEQEPSRIHDWLRRLREDAKGMSDDLSNTMSQSTWSAIEEAFWRQWSWMPNGPIRNQEISEVTVLDLMHTTRHANVPVVPALGGYLSISQWSRILSLALRAGYIVPPNVIDAAEKALAIPVLDFVPRSVGDGGDLVAAIRPWSSQSSAWTWQPQRGALAIALMPDDVAVADRTTDDERIRDPIEDAVLGMKEHAGVEILEFVELGGDVTLAAARNRPRAPGATDRIFFGTGSAPVDAEYYVQSPTGVRDLLERARRSYEHLFPIPPPSRSWEERNRKPWLALWEQIRYRASLARRSTTLLLRNAKNRLNAWARAAARRIAGLGPSR